MTPNGGRSWTARLMAGLTLLVVLGCAAAGWWVFQPELSAGPRKPEQLSATQPAMVEPGRDYYVHVKLIELPASPPGGGSWDPRGGAPDIRYRLHWNGTAIFTSPERSDRLIAEWDLLRLDLRDAILSGHVEIASAVSAPIIRAEEGGVLRIEVWDEDYLNNDEAGSFDLPVESLHEGLNTLRPGDSGVVRLVLDMIPRDLPLPDLLERASNR